jgi:hypothetical protein
MLGFHDGGEGGIRTLDGFRHAAFRERYVQPLRHLSMAQKQLHYLSTAGRGAQGMIIFE